MSSGKTRFLIITLICSLAVNLLLIGGAIGFVMIGPKHPPMPDHLGWILRGLDEEKREALRPELQAHARQVFPLRKEMRDAQRAFDELATKDEMDPAELKAALTRLRVASEAYQASTHEQLVMVLGRLDPQERQRVVSFVSRRRPDERPRDEPRRERD